MLRRLLCAEVLCPLCGRLLHVVRLRGEHLLPEALPIIGTPGNAAALDLRLQLRRAVERRPVVAVAAVRLRRRPPRSLRRLLHRLRPLRLRPRSRPRPAAGPALLVSVIRARERQAGPALCRSGSFFAPTTRRG